MAYEAEDRNDAAGKMGHNLSGRWLKRPPAASDTSPRAQAMTFGVILAGDRFSRRRGRITCSEGPWTKCVGARPFLLQEGRLLPSDEREVSTIGSSAISNGETGGRERDVVNRPGDCP